MNSEITWAAPLLMLPGAALLILSTASRYARLHDELHHWTEHVQTQQAGVVVANLLRRARIFRNALIALYLGASLFVIGGLAGAFTQQWPQLSGSLVVALTAAASGAVLGASGMLICEAALSITVLEAHIDLAEGNRAH